VSFRRNTFSFVLVAGLTAIPARGEGDGLAAAYPGDVDIGRDKAVLLHDDFENGDIGSKWDEVRRRKGRGATDDGDPVQAERNPAIARGSCSAKVQLRKDGHEDVTFVKWLHAGHDELYMRHYVRYGGDYGYHGHGGSGFMADAGKGGFRGAGKVPEGDKFFWATLEPVGRRDWRPPGALIFYAYWWKMKPDGKGDYWGNWFELKPDQVPRLEAWTCIEWRVKTNTPGQENGELDVWIDGRKCGEFRKINWRSAGTLKVNKVHLSLWLEAERYIRAGGGTTRTVWYDDVVVATKYIGPKAP
jgi:hypothetical protein